MLQGGLGPVCIARPWATSILLLVTCGYPLSAAPGLDKNRVKVVFALCFWRSAVYRAPALTSHYG